MLEIRNLTKVYRSKTGESVRALDNVSISFPESGMVFILGKSGSGKSTLLNVMGGLDSYDSGEFIIKGKSSKDFAGSDFDAYRNTFIGFIFQEYNVLDDFSVGANIGLALELQGKKATDEKINAILSQVDLLSYAKRKPNELSGGQKQRVAIARALVKEPQIIMADEPTGALDSNTGKQIFDTLKELSREKLVLIVSHDRDFAERYADRIIELSDGQIISDVTKHEKHSVQLSEGVQQITDNILRIKGGYRLTEADLRMINDYLSKNQSDIILSGDGRINDELRSAAGISAEGNTSVFEGTSEKDFALKSYQKEDSKFIHSRLPMKNAIKMGSSSLRHKKFRLVMTIFLSLIAFALFGFADSLGAYEKLEAAVASIQDSNIKTASLDLGVRREVWRDGELNYYSYEQQMLNDNDIALLKEKTGIDFIPVYAGSNPWDSGFSMSAQFQNYEQNTIYTGKLSGIVSISDETAAQSGLTVTGRLPEAEGEIAITELAYRQFNEYGFQNTAMKESVKAGALTTVEGDANSILGKHITLQGRNSAGAITYKIVGVVDTGFDYDRYNSLLPSDQPAADEDDLATMVLVNEATGELTYGFHMLAFLCESDLKSFTEATFTQEIGEYMNSVMNKSISFAIKNPSQTNTTTSEAKEKKVIIAQKGDVMIESADGVMSQESGNRYNRVAGSDALSLVDVTWLDGTTRTALGANEIVIPKNLYDSLFPSEATVTISDEEIGAEVNRLYGAGSWEGTDPAQDYGARWLAAAKQSYLEEQRANTQLTEAIRRKLFEEQFPDATEYNPEAINDQQIDELWNRWQNGDETLSHLVSDFSVKQPYEIEEEARNAGAEFVLKFSGLEALESYFTKNEEALEFALRQSSIASFSRLQELTTEWQSYTVSASSYTQLLRYIHAYRHVTETNALADQNFIEAVIRSHQDYGQQWALAKSEDEKINIAIYAYETYLSTSEGGYDTNPFGEYTGSELNELGKELLRTKANVDIDSVLSGMTFSLREEDYETGGSRSVQDYQFKVVGYFTSNQGDTSFVISDTVLADYQTWHDEMWQSEMDYQEVRAEHENGKWMFVLAPMPADSDLIRTLVELGYDEDADLQFTLQNAVMNTLDSFNDFIEVGAQVFLYVGIGFAVFSALLLMNFISTSISYKKREIGVLRAVGARSSDVFKIFFSEALIIALINFILALGTALAAVLFANGYMRSMGINITLLTFGIRQILLMLAVSVLVALLASFLPVYSIAKRKPIDAIRDR